LLDLTGAMYRHVVFLNGNYGIDFDATLRECLGKWRPLDRYDHDEIIKGLKWGSGLLSKGWLKEKANGA
jgi:hypothetical protein